MKSFKRYSDFIRGELDVSALRFQFFVNFHSMIIRRFHCKLVVDALNPVLEGMGGCVTMNIGRSSAAKRFPKTKECCIIFLRTIWVCCLERTEYDEVIVNVKNDFT